jgi:hypothetical protein
MQKVFEGRSEEAKEMAMSDEFKTGTDKRGKRRQGQYVALSDRSCEAIRQWPCGAIRQLEPPQGDDGGLPERPLDLDQPSPFQVPQHPPFDVSACANLVRAKDLLERAKLLLWGGIASAIGAGSLRRQSFNLVEHAPEQHPLRLAVADLAATNKCLAQSSTPPAEDNATNRSDAAADLPPS